MKRWVGLILALALCVGTAAVLGRCGKKETLPQPEFLLSEETLAAALEESGLDWSIEQTDEASNETTAKVTYTLHRTEDREGYNGVFISSYNSEEYGRRLQVYYREPQNKEYWNEADDACWEDWQAVLGLLARLYGGFEDVEEIYRTCAEEPMSHERNLLWEGSLTGGYFYMMTENRMKPERLSMGNTVTFNLFGSEDAYLRWREMIEASKAG